MIYQGNIDQRHMAAFLDQIPASEYDAEQLDRSLIELAGRVSRGCIRGVVTAILAGDERTADWALLSNLSAYEQADILERGTSRERADELRRRQGADKAREMLRRRNTGAQLRRAVTDAQESAQRRADAGDDPNAGPT